MDNFDRKKHWEQIYQSKKLEEVSWFQPTPHTSLEFFKNWSIPLTAKVIDVGGGDSLLVDHLLELGYQDVTVLDISEAAIERAKHRLGELASKVTWIVADATSFTPNRIYDVWHDRAAFHFLTHGNEINEYVLTAQRHISSGGLLIMGTFSENGPKKCSGIVIKQYSEKALVQCFIPHFKKLDCHSVNHTTPSGAIQNFIFCAFRKKSRSSEPGVALESTKNKN